MVTENLFGDILTDEAADDHRLHRDAALGQPRPPATLGLYEPVHGSAPDIAGQGIANPIATCLSAAMMLRYSLGAPEAADRIDAAVDAVLDAGHRTRDLGGDLGTREVGDLILAALGAAVPRCPAGRGASSRTSRSGDVYVHRLGRTVLEVDNSGSPC